MFVFSEIDECSEGISSCNMQCVNTIGSYYCSCFLGFQLMSDNHTCEGKGKMYLLLAAISLQISMSVLTTMEVVKMCVIIPLGVTHVLVKQMDII